MKTDILKISPYVLEDLDGKIDLIIDAGSFLCFAARRNRDRGVANDLTPKNCTTCN